MITHRKALGLVSLAGVLAPLMGCASAHDAKEKYYMIATNIKVGYWKTAADGFIRACNEMKVLSEVTGPDTYDAKAEADEFRRVAKLKPTGILVATANAEMLKGDIDSAIASGVPVITFDSDAPGSKRLFFIGTNNYEAGKIGGQLAAKQMGGRGNLVVFTMPGQPNLDERLHGYREVFASSPGMKITEVVDMKGDPRIVFDTATDIINKRKNSVDGFICLEAQGGKEVADVLDRNNVTGKTIVAMDTDDATMNWIQKGRIAGTIAQKPFTMAYFGANMLDATYHRKLKSLDVNTASDPFSTFPAFVDTGATLIDKGNIGSFTKSRDSAKSE